MDKEHVKRRQRIKLLARARKLRGTSPATRTLETEGKVDQAKGTVHKKVGDTKDAGKKWFWTP